MWATVLWVPGGLHAWAPEDQAITVHADPEDQLRKAAWPVQGPRLIEGRGWGAAAC